MNPVGVGVCVLVLIIFINAHILVSTPILLPYFQMQNECKIELYCAQNFEEHHKALEENFSRAAFEAVSETDLAHIKKIETSMEAKIKILFSKKFDKEWPKTKAGQPIENTSVILKHILDWSFFSQCIGLGCKLIFYVVCHYSSWSLSSWRTCPVYAL